MTRNKNNYICNGFKKALKDSNLSKEQEDFILQYASAEEKAHIKKQHNKCVKNSTALIFAAKHAPSIVKSIIDVYKEIDINAKDAGLYTALMYAASYANLTAVEAILASEKAEIDCVDEDQCNALHWAVTGGDPNILQKIIDFIKSQERDVVLKIINAQDKDRRNPLMYIMIANYIEISQRILMLQIIWDVCCQQSICDEVLYAKDKDGYTTLDYLSDFLTQENSPKIPENLLMLIKQDPKAKAMYIDIDNDTSETAAADLLLTRSHQQPEELSNNQDKESPLLFNHAPHDQKNCTINLRNLRNALKRPYSPDNNNCSHVLQTLKKSKNSKIVRINNVEWQEIELLIKQRYKQYFCTGGMRKTDEMTELAKSDENKLREILSNYLQNNSSTKKLEHINKAVSTAIKV